MKMKGLWHQLALISESPHLLSYKSRRLSVENHQLPRRSFSNMRTFTIVSLALLAGLLILLNLFSGYLASFSQSCTHISNMGPALGHIFEENEFIWNQWICATAMLQKFFCWCFNARKATFLYSHSLGWQPYPPGFPVFKFHSPYFLPHPTRVY